MDNKTYKVKLNIKNKRTLEGLKRLAGVYRKFYNLAMDYQSDCCIGLYDNDDYEYLRNPNVRFRTGTQVADHLRDIRKKCSYAKKVDNGIIIKAAFAASKAYLSAWKYKIPKYMSRKKNDIRFKTNDIKVFYNYVQIRKFEKIQLCEGGRIPQGKQYSDITFSFDGKDWWLSLAVSEKYEKASDLSGSASIDFDTDGSMLLNGEKFLDNIANSENYQKVNLRYKRALKKYKRQVKANTTLTRSGKLICRTSKNMMKTRKKVQLLSNRLKSIKKDYFRKAVKELAKHKLLNVFALSKRALGKFRNGYLSRKLRESGALELFDVTLKNLALLGSNIIRCESPSQLLSIS